MNLIGESCPAFRLYGAIIRLERMSDIITDLHLTTSRVYSPGIRKSLDHLRPVHDDLVAQGQHLRDRLARIGPDSLEGALSQLIIAEEDYRSRDAAMISRATALADRACAFCSGYELNEFDELF